MNVAPKIKLKLQPIPKTIVYAGMGGEFVKNIGMTDDAQIRALQQIISEGIIDQIVVAARHADGRIEKFTLAMRTPDVGATVDLDMSGEKSYLEAMDTGLAASVAHASAMVQRRGLTPTFYVGWSPQAQANPAIITEACQRLNLKVGQLPSEPVGDPVGDDGIDVSYPPVPPARSYQPYTQPVNSYTGPPKLPANYEFKPVVKIQPAKDPGVEFTYETSRRIKT